MPIDWFGYALTLHAEFAADREVRQLQVVRMVESMGVLTPEWAQELQQACVRDQGLTAFVRQYMDKCL